MHHLTKLSLAALVALGITVSAGAADAKPGQKNKVSKFDKMDVNGDGQLSLDEMKQHRAMNKARKQARKQARKLNKQHKRNGKRHAKRGKNLTAKQKQLRKQRRQRRVKRKGARRMTIAQRFARIDINGDGYISRAEMAKARTLRKARRMKHRKNRRMKHRKNRRTKVRGVVTPPKARPIANPPARVRTVKVNPYTFSARLAAGFKLAFI